jgi:hypothetical protein
MLVFMSLSETYDVPPELALLYDFLNTLHERRYMENGALHNGGDEISTPLLRAEWMRARSLLGADARPAHSAQVQSNGLYRLRLRDVKMATSIENFFCELKEFRKIATRYEKTDQTCSAMIHLVGSPIAIR